MIGRFLGRDVPATGFSIGFERILELIDLPADAAEDACALLYDDTVAARPTRRHEGGAHRRRDRACAWNAPARTPARCSTELAASGYRQVATVSAATAAVDDLEFRDLT